MLQKCDKFNFLSKYILKSVKYVISLTNLTYFTYNKFVMKNLFSAINKKISGFIWSFIGTGFFLLILGVLIVWTDFVLRLLIGLLVIALAYAFFYGAYKAWTLKGEINKHIKFLK